MGQVTAQTVVNAKEKTPEVSIIQKLQSQVHRFKHEVDYEPLQAKLDRWRNAAPGVDPMQSLFLKRSLDKVEQSLRESLTTIDLEVMVDYGLDSQSMAEANSLLQTLCGTLEQLVNPELLLKSNMPCSTENGSAYSRLEKLIDIVTQNEWTFDLVAGVHSQQILFQVQSIETAILADQAVTGFNQFFKRLHQPAIRDIVPKQVAGVEQDSIDRAWKLVSCQKRPFERLLFQLQKASSCARKGHIALLQLADCEKVSENSFHLFLSACTRSDCWLEAHLETSCPDDDWEEICDSICSSLRRLDAERNGLFLTLQNEKIYIFDPVSDRTRRPFYPGKQPTTTLADLFAEHAFFEKPPGHWIPQDTQNLFLRDEKRGLAAKLVLGLGYQWDPDHVLSTWDAQHIYFLTNEDGTCLREAPFALCDSYNVADHENMASKTSLSDVQSLVKLLLEIEYGILLPRVRDSAQLSKLIRKGLEEDFGRLHYLEAVEACLDFHYKAKKLARRMNGQKGNYATMARMITSLQLAERIRAASLHMQSRSQETSAGAEPGAFPAPTTINLPPQVSRPVEPVIAPTSQHSPEVYNASNAWFQRFNKLAFALQMGCSTSDNPIKIAILDTGLSEKYKNTVPPERYHDFVDPTNRSCQDLAGHGTSMFRVLRKVYSSAQIYVGRVWEGNQAGPNTADLMTKAINYAATTWQVDIIAMPSGFKSWHQGMYDEICEVSRGKKPVLIFAAPSNWSNTEEVAFPARLYRDHTVMTMFSTTAQNKPTPKFNPAPARNFEFNLAIFGEMVSIPPKDVFEGTSVSTMIGAGLAGRILAFAQQKGNEARIGSVKSLRMAHGMATIFKAMSIHENGYDCIRPERLLPDGDDYSDEEMIEHVCVTIRSCLNNRYR
ncbi:hypothetical protein K461DRAFT_68431 [Myriangium duriaei CBS 260.36]|uniref:DUF7580 domain-containing protein n=1 Tax=Myriangium duriaei CBS 260.36 TaxID=1168546 RepID=A0A9P4IWD5_9PEZI|nr:hypothetical protein K461DRAFT_68431 [Myriangium duriaei CBS 260.36]